MKKVIIIFTMVILLAIICAVAVNMVGRSALEKDFRIANPASVFCVKQGYKSEIRYDDANSHSQYGVCVFGDGNECEEWKFFRSECGEDYVR